MTLPTTIRIFSDSLSAMKRAALVFTLITLCVACRRPRSEDPYWVQADKMFLEFADLETTSPTDAAAVRRKVDALKTLRRDAALLPHAGWANRYHDLLIDFMQTGINRTEQEAEILEMIADHSYSSSDALQRKVDEAQKRITEKYNKAYQDLSAERRKIDGPPWPIPAMRTPL